jgi:metal-responsive CopG/Arc/MetJ family transcriptional regulator
MARSDWQTVSLPIGLLSRLQEYLESEHAKNNGFISKSDVIVFLLREFLSQWQTKKEEDLSSTTTTTS